MSDTLPRKRGRPPGPPKPQKPPAKMGRPSPWDDALKPTVSGTIRAPEKFFSLWEQEEFKRRVNDLILNFSK